jgi:hypothetical protein
MIIVQILRATIAGMEEEREQLRVTIAQLNQQLIDKDEQVKVTYRKQSAVVGCYVSTTNKHFIGKRFATTIGTREETR